MDEPSDPIRFFGRRDLCEEAPLADTDPDLVAGMERLRILREAEQGGVLEFRPRTELRPR